MSEGIDVAEDPSSIIGFACSHNRADTAIEKVSGMSSSTAAQVYLFSLFHALHRHAISMPPRLTLDCRSL